MSIVSEKIIKLHQLQFVTLQLNYNSKEWHLVFDIIVMSDNKNLEKSK